MVDRVLFINACVRPDSRTAELAHCLIDALSGDVTEIDLYKKNLLPIDGRGLEIRSKHDYSREEFRYARQFADADIIVIATPFWDLSFPAVLKIYLENITVSGITFEYSQKGRPVGKCRAKKLYYITTSGGYIGENNYGFDYVKALSENFYGIKDVCFYSAQGLDIFGADISGIMEEAKKSIRV